MSFSEQFQIYSENTINLVRSMIIKSEDTNRLINEYFTAVGQVPSTNPLLWKYYLNISGEYHPNDTVMQVTSSDTQSTIDFTKANLVTHPVTYLSYARGGVSYRELVSQFPMQEILINGITRPVDINVAIAAKDFEILGWDESYVGAGETTLKAQVQDWIYKFVARWHNQDFALTDSLYPASFLALLYMHLPNAIMNIRLENCLTEHAADFHIWTYLSGHYEIDNYRNYLTHRQAMYLYRNVVSIRRNAGKVKTLEELFDNISKPHGISPKKADFVQLDDALLTSGRPTPRYTLTEYADANISYDNEALLDTQNILRETEDKAVDNIVEMDTDLIEMTTAGKLSTFNKIPTGFIKFDEDIATSVITESDVQLRVDYWIYLSSLGLYTNPVSVNMPGRPDMYLTAQNALILLVYATNRASGIELVNIPTLNVKNVVPVAYPTAVDLRPLGTAEDITDGDITEALAGLVVPRAVSGLAELEAFIAEIQQQRLVHELQWDKKTNTVAKSQMRDIINGCYIWKECSLVSSPTTFNTWMSSINFNKYGLTGFDWYEIAIDILLKVAGVTREKTSLSPSKSAMVSIIDSLTSYSLIVAEGESFSKYRALEFPSLLPGKFTGSERYVDYLDHGLDVPSNGGDATILNFNDAIEAPSLVAVDSGIYSADYAFDYGLELIQDNSVTSTVYLDFPGVYPEDVVITHTTI